MCFINAELFGDGAQVHRTLQREGEVSLQFHKKDVVAFIGRLKYEFRPKYIHNKLDGDKDCYIEWIYLNKQRYSKIQYDSDGEGMKGNEGNPFEFLFFLCCRILGIYADT